jgi:hypothetical protein
MSVGVAQADTNYDFSSTISGSGEVISATLTNVGGGSYIPFSSISNLSSTLGPLSSPTIIANTTNGLNGVWGYGNTAGENIANVNFIFQRASDPLYYSLYAQNTLGSISGGTGNLFSFASMELAQGGPVNALNNIDATSATFTVSGGAAAPEMNASLIPQVGLLLGCLFFLFGRKKEVVEPMMTA